MADFASLSDLAATSLKTQTRRLSHFLRNTKKISDAEHVHQTRVTIRRLRAALTIFTSVLPSDATHIREELGWLATQFGTVRDIDVQIAQIQSWQSTQQLDVADLKSVLVLMQRRRRQSAKTALAAVDSVRSKRMLLALKKITRPVREQVPEAQSETSDVVQTLHEQVAHVLSVQYRRVRQAGDRLRKHDTPEHFHRLRIRCKRLRYALEFAAPVCGDAYIKPLVTRLTKVQDTLGSQQDAVVAAAFLAELRATPIPKATKHVLADLEQKYQRQAHAVQDAFPKAYRKLRGRVWRAFRNESG